MPGTVRVWISYDGVRWSGAGAAVPFDPAAFNRVGTLHGFPVYVRRSTGAYPDTIFVPVTNGKVTPYRRGTGREE